MRGYHDEKEEDKKKSGRGREKEKPRMERGGRGGRAALWLLLCRNVNTLQRSQKTMTPQGEEGVCASVFLLSACVRSVCVWVQQQHYGERKETDGGEMREKEREGERESRPWQNWRYEISIKGEQHFQLKSHVLL